MARLLCRTGNSEVFDVDRLPRRGTLRDRVGELHVAHAVLEGGVRDLLAAADRADELLLDAPADALRLRHVDLLQLLVAATSTTEPLRLRLDAQRALGAVDPRLRHGRE